MELQCFFIVTALWVFSVCLHEFGHAWVAWKGGDFTVVDKGYLTMNPLRYTHSVNSILLPVLFMAMGGIGLPGGAVYINRSLLRSRVWETSMSLAGPAMNLLLILVISLLFKLGIIPSDQTKLSTVSMAFLFQLQVCALLLNLLPIPPLDGFQAIAPWLPAEMRERMQGAANVGIFVVFIALSFIQPVSKVFWMVVSAICNGMGVDGYWAYLGYKAFRFWAQ